MSDPDEHWDEAMNNDGDRFDDEDDDEDEPRHLLVSMTPCCKKEQRNWNGWCVNCGSPCF